MKKKWFLAFFVIWAVATAPSVWSFDFFIEGERLFRENKPAEAAPLLYQASLRDGTDPRVFIYLGLCYQQLGRYDDAITTFMKGTSARGSDKRALFFNAGNIYFLRKSYHEAEQMFTRSIDSDSAFAPAYLNRANSRLQMDQPDRALSDYTVYLMLDPATPQKERIQELVRLLSAEVMAREEAARRAEAERLASEAEKERLAQEAVAQAARLEAERLAAAERYKQLLDEVSSSLLSVGTATTLSAGSEGVMEYSEEGELE